MKEKEKVESLNMYILNRMVDWESCVEDEKLCYCSVYLISAYGPSGIREEGRLLGGRGEKIALRRERWVTEHLFHRSFQYVCR
jgi:hypothetical protein